MPDKFPRKTIDDRLTVGEAAIRALAELRQRIEELAQWYEQNTGAEEPRTVHPSQVARDLRRLLEK